MYANAISIPNSYNSSAFYGVHLGSGCFHTFKGIMDTSKSFKNKSIAGTPKHQTMEIIAVINITSSANSSDTINALRRQFYEVSSSS
jgi:hypothetical protein